MLFASLPMGSESYHIFIAPDNEDISSDDYATLNGKRIGINRGSVQKGMFLDWARAHGITAEIVDLTGNEIDSMKLLRRGDLDAFVTMDIFGGPETAVPICKIGASDIYFAVNKDRPDLLASLDAAMNRIQDENAYYNQQLHEKYLSNGGAGKYLSASEKAWLTDHGTIRVGYQDNYLAFCAADKTTGELTGALKDYLSCAADCLEGVHLDFEAVGYPTVEAAMEDLKKGKVDCVFPANFSGYDGEKLGVVLSPPLMSTDVYAVVRQADMNSFANRQHVVVA
jgi:ABC-type amino acid transport substrate-binding protein